MSRFETIDLKIEFKSSWGTMDAESPGSSIADLKVRKINRISFTKDGKSSINREYWIPGTIIKGTLRAVAIRLDENSCKTSLTKKMCDKCIVCSIFGGSKKSGKIKAYSTYIDTNQQKSFVQPRIALNRKKRSAATGSLFFIEKLPKLTTKIHLELNDLNEEEKKFFNTLLVFWSNYGFGAKKVPFTILEQNSKLLKEEGK